MNSKIISIRRAVTTSKVAAVVTDKTEAVKSRLPDPKTTEGIITLLKKLGQDVRREAAKVTSTFEED